MAENNSTPKAGIRTTEWWSMIACHAVALAALFGVVAPGDVLGLNDALSKAIGGAAIFIANAWVVVKYMSHRTLLKRLHLLGGEEEEGQSGIPLVAVLACLFLVAAADRAAAAPPTVRALARNTTDAPQVGLFNFGFGRGQQQPQQAQPGPQQVQIQSDPALIAVLQQMAQQNGQLLAALSKPAAQAAPPSCPCQPKTTPQTPQPQSQPPLIYLAPQSQGCPCPKSIQQGQAPYNPQPLPQGYAPQPLPPTYQPHPLPQSYSPQPLPGGYSPQIIINPPGQPGYNPHPLPVQPQPQPQTPQTQPAPPAQPAPPNLQPAAQPQRYALYRPVITSGR
jgi:hypothetical protein